MHYICLSLMLVGSLLPGKSIPKYFVKFVQKRTLFANNEPVVLAIRLGNQSERPMRSRKFPDLLKNLKIERDGEALKLAKGYDSRKLFVRSNTLEMGSHRDFRLDLRRYFPDITKGGVFKVSYKDKVYDIEGLSIKVAPVALPDLEAHYVLRTLLGDITIELESNQTPNHARNFAILTAMNFYQDMVFHRVEKGFVIQTGDPVGTGEGGSGFSVALEKSPVLKHKPYVVGMARALEPDSATSQFYITLGRAPALDSKYTVFGKVVKGQDVVDLIGQQPTTGPNQKPANQPLKPIGLRSIDIIPKTDNQPE